MWNWKPPSPPASAYRSSEATILNTSQLSRYAPAARRAFIAAVAAKAARLGITAKGNAPAEVRGDVLIVGGEAFPRAVAPARQNLVERVQARVENAKCSCVKGQS